MVQHGRIASVLAPGRRTWPCRYGRQHLVTGPCSRGRFRLSAARNRRRQHTTAERPSLPGRSTATDGRQDFYSRSFQGAGQILSFFFSFTGLVLHCCTLCTVCNGTRTGASGRRSGGKGTVHAAHFTDHEANSFASCQQTASATCLWQGGLGCVRLCGMAVGGGRIWSNLEPGDVFL